MWCGLALYARDIDRRRQLPDVYMTYVPCGNSSVSMRVSEKAGILWQILQDDALFRIQTRMWWRAVGFMLRKAFVRSPAVLLAAVSLMYWLSPDKVVALVADIQTGAATCQVYAAGNILFVVYVLTGGAFGLCEMLRKQEGDFFCFAQKYQEQVRGFALTQRKVSDPTRVDNVSLQEGGE